MKNLISLFRFQGQERLVSFLYLISFEYFASAVLIRGVTRFWCGIVCEGFCVFRVKLVRYKNNQTKTVNKLLLAGLTYHAF